MLAVAMDPQGRSLVEPYKRRNRLTFAHLLDPENKVSGAYGVRGVPTSFLVDKEGNIVARVVGPKGWADTEFQMLFEEMVVE